MPVSKSKRSRYIPPPKPKPKPSPRWVPKLMIGLLAAGSIGYAAVGTLFAAMLARSRSRGALLPVLLYPITVPVIIGGVRGTAALLGPEADLAVARAWLMMLVSFDAVFVTLSLWTFEPAMTD